MVVLALLPACRGCTRTSGSPNGAAASASGAASARTTLPPAKERARVKALVSAEARRDSKAVTEGDLASRSVSVRRHAARALARIGDARAADLLSHALADEDPRVVTWAAFGLGQSCSGREHATVKALVSRAAALALEPPRPKSGTPSGVELDPIAAIAGALGRCGSSDAERTLRAWLDGPHARAEDAALALGTLASRHKRLDDATVVALLDAASRKDKPLARALFPISRLGSLKEPVQTRLLAIADKVLDASKGDAARFAVRALARAGDAAVEPLSRVLVDEHADAGARADAARELARFGESGQKALADALAKLAPTTKTADAQHLVSASWGPLVATLDALAYPARAAKDELEKLAELPIPKNAPAALKRRIVKLRCSSAALLAGTASLASRLVACDPDKDGRTGALAVVGVLGRGQLTAARYRRWKTFAGSGDPVVRQAAIQLIPEHPEIPHPQKVLESALAAKQAGTVATAAQVLAGFPDRAETERSRRRTSPDAGAAAAVKPATSLVKVLTQAFDAKRAPDAIEVRCSLMDAAAALQLLAFKPKIDPYCHDPNPTLRQHAEKALRQLGNRDRKCDHFTPPEKAPPELSHVPAHDVKIELDTDVGKLELGLDPDLAPVTTSRVVQLVRAGFYNNMSVHRVVAGFVVQFGDPEGDGYGGPGQQPLPNEETPRVFEPLTVGVALAGPDTGSSQLFVTLGPYPHLDGNYPLVGRASGKWGLLTIGDVIHKATVAAP